MSCLCETLCVYKVYELYIYIYIKIWENVEIRYTMHV
jgi:hypothetical protein